MIKATFVGAFFALACTGASAGNSEIKYTDIAFDSAAPFTMLGGSLSASFVTGSSSATDSFTFAGSPTAHSFSMASDGANAGLTFGPSFIDVWGGAGMGGSSYSISFVLTYEFEVTNDFNFSASMNALGLLGGYAEPIDGPSAPQAVIVGTGVSVDSQGGGEPFGGYIQWLDARYGIIDGMGAGNWVQQGGALQFIKAGGAAASSTRQHDGHATVAFYGTTSGRSPVVTPVPEPSTYALMLVGLAALGFTAKRRALNLRVAHDPAGHIRGSGLGFSLAEPLQATLEVQSPR